MNLYSEGRIPKKRVIINLLVRDWNACHFAAGLECMSFCGPLLVNVILRIAKIDNDPFFGNAPILEVTLALKNGEKEYCRRDNGIDSSESFRAFAINCPDIQICYCRGCD